MTTAVRAFLPRGQVAHLIDTADQTRRAPCLRCGRHPVAGYLWRVPRSRAERERAIRCPLCRKMFKE